MNIFISGVIAQYYGSYRFLVDSVRFASAELVYGHIFKTHPEANIRFKRH